MYTNGLKDRFGSPLISQRDLEPTIDTINGRLTSTETNLEDVNFNINGLTTDLDDVTKEMFKLKNQLDTEYVTVGKLEEVYNEVDTQVIKGLVDRYTVYDNAIFPIATEGSSNAYVTSFRFGYKHCPKGLIKKVITYARDASTTSSDAKVNGCYLIAKVYNKADGTLVREQSSKNKLVVIEKQSNESVRPTNTWEFDGILAPNENEVIKFVPSSDGKTQVSGYTVGLLIDSTHTHIDCRCNGDDDFANNPLGNGNRWMPYVKFEGDFYKDKEPKKEIEEFEKTFLKSIYTTEIADVFNNNIYNETLGMGSVKAFVIARPYLANGLFSEMKWTSQGNVSSTCKMKITLKDLNGNPVRSLMSSNSLNFSTAGEKIYQFDEFEITDNIGSILCEGSTDGVNVSNSSQFRVAIIGNSTKADADGSEVTNNPFVCHVIFRGKKARVGGDILTKTAADSLYASKSGVTTTSYDWTPDYTNNIKLDVHEYTFPVNGWLVSRDWQYLVEQQNEIRIDDKPVGQVNDKGNFSILCKKDEVLTIENGLDVPFWFFPCKSEQYDYRVTHTPYDVWRGAVTTDAQGNTVVQNMHCPDASNWESAHPSIQGTITKVEDEVAYDANGNVVCNIQTSEIVKQQWMFRSHPLQIFNSDLQRLEDGFGMFMYSELERFDSDLSSLTNGDNMFDYCSNLTTFTSDLSSLTNGNNMFGYCYQLESFNSDLSSLTNGDNMFDYCSNLTTFTSDLSSLKDGNGMFFRCPNLTTFTSDLSSLTNGTNMFNYCYQLESFNSDLSSLTRGDSMFNNCSNLTTFESDLSSLTNGERMFYYCTNLETFNADLSSLTNGSSMFAGCSSLVSVNTNLSSLTNGFCMFDFCSSLESFDADLSSLTNGEGMFYNCTNLTTFTSDLSSLTNGADMFGNCKLDAQSVERILTTIPEVTEQPWLTMTLNTEGCDRFVSMLGLTSDDLEKIWEVGTRPDVISYKGWKLEVTCSDGDYILPTSPTANFDVSEANGYIPDASKWHDEVYVPNDLTIIQVINGIAYDDDAVDPEL